MSEEKYVEKMLGYLENAFKYITGTLSAIIVYLVFNYDGSTLSVLASVLAVICIITLIFCSFMLKRYLNKLRRL